MRTWLAAGLLLVPLFTGCLASTEDNLTPNSAAVVPEDALEALARGEPSANLDLLGSWANGNGAEIAAWGDMLYVMRAGTVQILNVSDPTNITEVSVIQGTHRVLDVKVSDDGKYLFIGDDTQASGDKLGEPTGRTGGTYVYDVSNPEAPRFVTHQRIGEVRGPHMVSYHRMPDGGEIILGANADISISRFNRDTETLTEIARYQPDLIFGFNRDPQVFDVLYQGWAHDMFAMNEADGTVLMYVANWDAGLRIVDITDPSRPQELSGWNAFPDGHEGNLHTVSTSWIDDRRITVGAVEVGFAVVGGYHYAMGTDTSVVYIWDTTDTANIELLGTWENPHGEKAKRDMVDGTVTSTHNLQLETGRIYLAHYGLGVWVLDVSTPDLQETPQILAYYQQEGQNTWDIILHNGVTYTSGAEGILALHFTPDILGIEGITSRA